MLHRFLRAALPVLVATAMLVSPGIAGTPLESIDGSFAGKFKSKNQVINPELAEPGSATDDSGLVVFQDGNDVSATLVVFGAGGDPDTVFTGSGSAGNGKFFLHTTDGEGGTLFIVGSMKGTEGNRTIKGRGAFLAAGIYSDVKVSYREGDSGITL